MEVVLTFSDELRSNPHAVSFADSRAFSFISKSTQVRKRPDSYNVLVLNYDNEPLESITSYKSQSMYDVFAFMDRSINISDLDELCGVLINILQTPGVLQKNQIALLTKFNILIYGSNKNTKNIKPAKYELKLSEEYYIPSEEAGGITINAKDITIEPLSFVIARAEERCNFPKNICGLFDLRVSLFCAGIILSNGVQVDPGYRGVLLSLLFNSGASQYHIKSGDNFSHIMFITLSGDNFEGYEGINLDSSSIPSYIPASKPSSFSFKNYLETLKKINEMDEKLADAGAYIKLLRDNDTIDTVIRFKGTLWNKIAFVVAIIAIGITVLAGSPIALHLTRSDDIHKRLDYIETILEQNKPQIINEHKATPSIDVVSSQ